MFQDALKMEEGAMSQGIQAPLEVRKGENIIYPKHSKDMLPCQHLDFSPVKPMLNFQPPEQICVVLCHSVCGSWLQKLHEWNTAGT